MRINNQTVAHVLPVATRVRGGRPATAFDAVVSAELVACTLGARRRPELHSVAYAEGGTVTRREPLPVR